MRSYLFILLFITQVQSCLFAGVAGNSIPGDTAKTKYPLFSVGTGFIYSSLNFYKNAKEFTYYRGYGTRGYIQFNENFRVAADYSQVSGVNIVPTWVNVKSTYYDLDAHFLMHFSDKVSMFYFVLGASVQNWQGYYTGLHDVNYWLVNIPPKTDYSTWYLGATMGFGAEARIIGSLRIYGEFRFRVSKTDVGSGLNDVLYGGGLKLDIHALKRKKQGHSHSILKFRDKYHWF